MGDALDIRVFVGPCGDFNALNSYLAAYRRAKERRPNHTLYELSYWFRALEYVAYFVLYTFLVPILGYLVATLRQSRLAWRQSIARGAGSSWVAFGVILVFPPACKS